MSLWHVTVAPSSRANEQGEHCISSLLQMLGRVHDPRSPHGKRHELVFVLAVSVVAVLAGASSYRQIADQAADLPQPLLRKLGATWNWFTLRYGWPSEPTIRRVLEDIDGNELDLLVGTWLFERARRHTDGLLVIALDGKVLRGAWTGEHEQFTLFSAMIHGQGVSVGQVRVPDGTNEITQVEALLDSVAAAPGEHVTITVDAAHTQRETAEYIKGTRGFDYVMTVKGNQPTLQREVFDRCRPLLTEKPHHLVEERGHGRVNRWSAWAADATGIGFPHAAQVACVRRDVFDLDGMRTSKELAFVITSSAVERTGPAGLHTHARQHWGIENKVHYVRDTTWREDANHTYVGNGPQTMAALRNLAMGLLRLNGIHTIKAATEMICRDRTRALPLLAT